MGARGRKSKTAEQLTVIKGDFGIARLAPPEDLTEAQALIWRGIVATEPVEFFNTAALADLLKDLCRHRAEIERLADTINVFPPGAERSREGMKVYHGLLKARDTEVQAAARIARLLRLTNSARYTPERAATASRHALKSEKFPWE